ncbi:MAG: RNA polymerase sigma factor [Acidimicrobiales bacterium]
MDPLTHLLVAARDGDRDALGDLVARTQPDVWRFCASIVGAGGADDASQETYLRAWRSAQGFRAEASAKTWLLAIARRVCWDQAKKERNHTARVVAAGPILAPAVVSDHGDNVALEDLVSRLTPERRSVFYLTQILGLSYEEAAEVCNCPVGTIRSRLARARGELIGEVDPGRRQTGPST